jgi:hypothetical protein
MARDCRLDKVLAQAVALSNGSALHLAHAMTPHYQTVLLVPPKRNLVSLKRSVHPRTMFLEATLV